MQTYRIPQTPLVVSRIAYGCMKIGGGWEQPSLTEAETKAAIEVVLTAYEQGITLFDHADIYAHGKSERAFAEALKARPSMRDHIVIQSKCGIRFAGEPTPDAPQRYDFSYDHIVESVEGSLTRLHTDYLDILLLHRPDPLVEPEEVARAFDHLQTSGKVRYFGVSNHAPAQVALLQAAIDQPIVINQVQLSLLHPYLIDAGVMVNRADVEPAHAMAAGILDTSRQQRILIQAWGPVAGGRLFSPPADAPEHVRQTAALIATLAAEKDTTPEAIAVAWLLRHPAGIQPIIGTTKPERVKAACQADTVTLSRGEWYRLYLVARGGSLP